MNEYAVVMQRAKRGFAVYAPDLPGCVAVGRTEEEAMARMAEAVAAHVRGYRDEKLAPPRASTKVYYAQSGERGALDELHDVSRILQNVVATGVKTTLEVSKQTRRIAKRVRR